MYTTAVPTDQRAGVRPIQFILDSGGGSFSDPVTLKVRPEDLTRTEPSRLTVHQTLGRGAQGWVDNFGEGLPTVTISGHTGWRAAGYNAQDGVQAFEHLNTLVAHAYHAAKQGAIDTGRDPGSVKLLFVDMLDNFAWSVAPTQFVLRRNKSRPLLMQYNISLQAVSTTIDSQPAIAPFFGSITSGLGALGKVINDLFGFANSIQGWVSSAVSGINGFIAPLASTVRNFAMMSTAVFSAVQTTVSSITNGVRGVANSAIGIARDLASVGVNVMRTISSIAGLPASIKSSLMRVAGAYNEVLCIFSNSLRPRKTYDNYEGLYGASNCSSTTGGRPGSVYLNENVFSMMQPTQSVIEMNTPAMASTAKLARTDPVMAPMPLAELDRHVANIVSGTKVNQ